jgi:hypothetical protein
MSSLGELELVSWGERIGRCWWVPTRYSIYCTPAAWPLAGELLPASIEELAGEGPRVTRL